MPSNKEPPRQAPPPPPPPLGKVNRAGGTIIDAVYYVGDSLMQIAKALNNQNEIRRATEESIRRYGYKPPDVI